MCLSYFPLPLHKSTKCFLFRIVMRMHFLNELPEYELAMQHVQNRGSPLHFGLSHHTACVKFND